MCCWVKIRVRNVRGTPDTNRRILPSISLGEADEAVQVEGGSAHFGIQFKSVGEGHAAIERFKAANLQTITEETTTCCYTVPDKV
ncbi:hypothetical protein [Gimesia algae]|uniref:Uncharacterized protein n=1 Tax=Gimesia algae TaxID=2527971 RepID=A0A517VHY9_9PLAN|nr:hypothetical protein [Gimesia algae]QDT92634.1 hypothetical protein Pan161_43020 [Gimesia algae]